jgi:hypothetical protein
LVKHVRGRILADELNAEHVEQLMLADTLDRTPDEARPAHRRLEDAAANLTGYLITLGIDPDDADRNRLRTVLEAAFPMQRPGEIAAVVEAIRGPPR